LSDNGKGTIFWIFSNNDENIDDRTNKLGMTVEKIPEDQQASHDTMGCPANQIWHTLE
jgi:hypothetical protein